MNITSQATSEQIALAAQQHISQRRLQVFLCHSSSDKPKVRELYLRLRTCNVAPWLDEENILPGQDWEHEIRKAVRGTDVVVVCLSRESINKAGYVQKEIKFALDVADEQPEGTIFIIPLRLEGCELPERLRRWQWVDYFEEKGFERLMSALKHRGESLNGKIIPINYRFDTKLSEEFTLRHILTGHSGSIWTVAMSPDKRFLASGSQDSTTKIWNLQSGELLHTLKGYSGTVHRVIISPDGQILVTGNADGTIKIWNLQTGELLHSRDVHSTFIQSLTLSPDGQTLVSTGADNVLKIENLQTGELLHTLKVPVYRITLSPDGDILAICDKTITLWNMHTLEILRTLTGHQKPIFSIAISPDMQIIASGSGDRTIKIWNLHTGKLLRTLRGHAGSINDISISVDEQTLASVSLDGTTKIWNLQTGEILQTLEHSGSVFSVVFSSDGQVLASGSTDKTIKIWAKKQL